jgi:hypothetical protein
MWILRCFQVHSQMFSSAFKLSIISRDDSYNWPEPDMVFIMVIWSFERPAILSQSFTFNKGWNINRIKFQIFSIKSLNHSSSNLAITFSKHSLSQNTQSILKRSWDFISIVFPYPDLSFTVHSWGLHIRLLSPNTSAHLDRGRFDPKISNFLKNFFEYFTGNESSTRWAQNDHLIKFFKRLKFVFR